MKVSIQDRPIVVIEDSDEDFEVTVWAVREAGVTNPIHRCADAAEIDALWAEHSLWPADLSRAYPLLVMQDLNLPGIDWLDTLHRLRADPWWRSVPVVIVSTSKQPGTVLACYRGGASGYLKKSVDLDVFAASMREVVAYWLRTVEPPPPPV
jgi:CheY-like chemotaxis protein